MITKYDKLDFYGENNEVKTCNTCVKQNTRICRICESHFLWEKFTEKRRREFDGMEHATAHDINR